MARQWNRHLALTRAEAGVGALIAFSFDTQATAQFCRRQQSSPNRATAGCPARYRRTYNDNSGSLPIALEVNLTEGGG